MSKLVTQPCLRAVDQRHVEWQTFEKLEKPMPYCRTFVSYFQNRRTETIEKYRIKSKLLQSGTNVNQLPLTSSFHSYLMSGIFHSGGTAVSLVSVPI